MMSNSSGVITPRSRSSARWCSSWAGDGAGDLCGRRCWRVGGRDQGAKGLSGGGRCLEGRHHRDGVGRLERVLLELAAQALGAADLAAGPQDDGTCLVSDQHLDAGQVRVVPADQLGGEQGPTGRALLEDECPSVGADHRLVALPEDDHSDGLAGEQLAGQRLKGLPVQAGQVDRGRHGALARARAISGVGRHPGSSLVGGWTLPRDTTHRWPGRGLARGGRHPALANRRAHLNEKSPLR